MTFRMKGMKRVFTHLTLFSVFLLMLSGCSQISPIQLLGNKEAARLLQQTLDEEGKTDKLLTQLAESSINVEAARPN